MILGAQKEPHCSIIWYDAAGTIQEIDNWMRFFLDFLTLIFIISLGGYISLKRPKHMKLVYVQLFLLFSAQLLYCIRSSARIYTDDTTYFGRYLPDWTYTCVQIGNMVNTMQHWMYASVYLDAALVTRLYFG